MADNYLITGYHGTPHVTAENDRGIHSGIMGAGRFILPTGEQFRAEYIGNNTIRMYDGKLIDGGAAAGIPAGEYVDLLISNAGQNMKRNDLIVFEYKKDASTMIETGAFAVVQGTETNGTPSDPTLVQSDLLEGNASHDQMAMWRVVVNGSTITNPVRVAEVSQAMRGHTHSASDISGGTIPITNGGTGATKAKAAEYNICGDMATTTVSMTDNSTIVCKRTTPSASAGVFIQRPITDLWTYLLGKIRSTFGFSSGGVLPITNGGTGNTTGLAALATKLATARTIRTKLDSTSTASFDGSGNVTPGVTGTLPIGNGGTGATDAESARTALGVAAATHKHNASDISGGTLPIARGGTNATTADGACESIGAVKKSGDTMTGTFYAQGSPAVVIGTTNNPRMFEIAHYTAADNGSRLAFRQYGSNGKRDNFNLPYTKDPADNVNYYILTSKNPVTVAQGGTGATTAADALKNLGLEIQTGTVNDVNSTGVTVTFKTAFSGVPVVVASGGSEASSVQVKNVTKTGFKIESPMPNNDGVQWIAVYQG